MKIYNVEVEWSGYSRGRSVYQVQAESEEEAKENWYVGSEISRFTVRDDTEVDKDTIKATEEITVNWEDPLAH